MTMRSKPLTLAAIALLSIATTACTALENDLQKSFRYGTSSQQLIEKVDADRKPGELPKGVNAYLWRAAMDTVGFLPLEAGVIMTKWYSAPQEFGTRSQLKVEILDPDLRRDTVRVIVAKQTQNADGSWSEAEAVTGTAQSLEDSIYTKARDIAPY
jgi:Domain of unknown function (DUF3576)